MFLHCSVTMTHQCCASSDFVTSPWASLSVLVVGNINSDALLLRLQLREISEPFPRNLSIIRIRWWKGEHIFSVLSEWAKVKYGVRSPELFGLLCTAVLIGWDPATPLCPSFWALLVSQDRRHHFVTPWKWASSVVVIEVERGTVLGGVITYYLSSSCIGT